MTLPSMAQAAVIARDAIGVSAVASIAYGAWLIYAPAGFIVGGMLVLAGVYLTARGDGGA